MITLHKLLSTCFLLLSPNFHSSHGAPTSEKFPEDSQSVKIVEGVPATPGEFPYLVSIQTKGGDSNPHVCGGVLVTLSVLITSAHCVYLPRLRDITVVAGAYYLEEAQLGVKQARTVANVTIYPGYSMSSSYNDVAVLKLSSAFQRDTSVGTLSFPRKDQESSGRCQIVGWGQTENNSYSNELRKGNITLNNKDACVRAYPTRYDRNFQLCAGNMNGETVNPCIGDTGGPLICSNNESGTKYLAGIMSWNQGCGQPGYPSVSMEVSKYRQWLDDTLSQLNNPGTTPTTTTKSPKPSDNEEMDTDDDSKNPH